MKLLTLFVLCSLLAAGCASSEKNSADSRELTNLVSMNPPVQDNYEESRIYVDTARIHTRENRKTLLITGNFPDGCTHIGKAGHNLAGDTLTVSLTTWRDPDMMCAQVLTPFTFIYDEVPDSVLTNRQSVLINGRSYDLQ